MKPNSFFRFSVFLADLRHGARLLLKSPITSAAAILSLALGIGGTTTMFSAVDAVLLRPLPFAEPERLVMVGATSFMTRGGSSTRRGGDLSPADYLDYRSSTSFAGLAAVSMNPVRLTGDGTPEQALAAQVSGNFFSVLGVNAIAGRTFLPADDAPGQPAQAVVSEALWERRYGRAADLVGRTIRYRINRSRSSASHQPAFSSRRGSISGCSAIAECRDSPRFRISRRIATFTYLP